MGGVESAGQEWPEGAFEPVPEGTVPVFHPDVEVFEVTDRETSEHVGLW